MYYVRIKDNDMRGLRDSSVRKEIKSANKKGFIQIPIINTLANNFD